jgi:hypothetical protein
MKQTDFFDSVKNSFNALWKYKVRGNSLEIITPYATTNDKFVSVFLTERNGEFIVSDGGWLSDEVYDTNIHLDDECYLKLYYHYESHYAVKTTIDGVGNTHFYKKTNNYHTVSNIVYDIANFITAIVSASLIQFQEVKEKEEKEFFTRDANAFMFTLAEKDNVLLHRPIGENLRNIRFSAIIKYPRNELALVTYITGSTYNYFQSSIARANLNFQIATKSPYSSLIKKKVAFVNDFAGGFQQDKLYEYLTGLEAQTTSPIIKWSEKEKLAEEI